MKLDRVYTRVRIAADEKSDTPPDIGEVSELIRNTLTDTYDIYPPNLSTEISPDGTIVIKAVDTNSGLNLQVSLQSLAGDFIHPSGQMTGIIPPEQAQSPGQMGGQEKQSNIAPG